MYRFTFSLKEDTPTHYELWDRNRSHGQHSGDIYHNAGGRMSLISTRPVITFLASEHRSPFSQYKITLLGDREILMSFTPSPIFI